MNDILHPNDAVTKDARALSSGTLSYLIQRTDYDSIYKVQAAFIQYCLDHAGTFTSWVEAWHEFDSTFDYASLDLAPQYVIVHTPDGDQYTFAPADQQISLGL